MKEAENIIACVTGITVAASMFFQPIEGTWLGHDGWAAHNLKIAAFVGAPCGVLLFWLRKHIWRSLLAALTVIVLLAFIGCAVACVYLSDSVPTFPDIADQRYFRDVVWKNAHLVMLISAILLVYSAFAYRSSAP
ncbi:hypothetical protein GHK39_28575 [Sinorhizobium medicae]|uniref:hypothetical protein n=1 Tax=Sinorhizobium medicae TaxID=110321 RepID=UPI001296233E|nr:hypothetical protein [Sinorhizobium medicae]MDX0631837.1 hypothetical protein [Sinorhizobium medicae]MQV88431.1 hypothetical protein [Sinorhizobium medicae]MQV94142.1 hypothetical protein [Sinorhizobium medicae]